MSALRNRKEAAKRLGLELQQRYQNLVEANPHDADEINTAAILLGALFNENIDFVINVLKDYGGLSVVFDRRKETKEPLPKTPGILLQ